MAQNNPTLDLLVIFNSMLGVANYSENTKQNEVEEDFKEECRVYFRDIIERLERLENGK